MACESNARLLQAYFDGELDLVRTMEFEDHLKSCPECAAKLSELQAIRKSLRSANLYEHAPQSLRSRVESEHSGSTLRPRIVPVRRHPLLEWLAIAAVIVIAIFVGARLLPNIGGQRQTNLLVQEAVASHIRSLQPGHLFDVQSTDQHTVKPWFDGKLDFAPPVTDLAAQGFPLIGGRLDYLDNRNVAALVYQRQKHFINVFIWPMQSSPAYLPSGQSLQGYNLVFAWRDGMYLCAVSDLNSTELQQFVHLLEQ